MSRLRTQVKAGDNTEGEGVARDADVANEVRGDG